MTPNKHETVDGHKVEQYYWSRELVVYIDNHAVDLSYDDAIAAVKDGTYAEAIASWKRKP